jgi:glycogen phosphorylase/synthase
MKTPDYIFETSWEVCNMIGGIYTVLSTKAGTLTKKWGDQYITIGPDVWKETTENPYFVEYPNLFPEWKQHAANQGFKIRIGRWSIPSKPLAILIDFTTLFSKKDDIFAKLWEDYQLDSIHGEWDYVEPAMFGYAAGQVIESFYDFYLTGHDHILAHFHEWMTGTGILYLKKNTPEVATVFTTHATAIGRSIASNNLPLYRDFHKYNPATMAGRFNMVAKQSLERNAATHADAFTTVSETTARECLQFLGRQPDAITINGFDESFVPDDKLIVMKRKSARQQILKVASTMTGEQLSTKTLMVIISGRYEVHNKGIDLFINAMGKLNKDKSLTRDVLAVIAVPAQVSGPNKELSERLGNPMAAATLSEIYSTHRLFDAVNDPVIKLIRENQLNNQPSDKVKIMFVPTYLNGRDGIFNIEYYDFLTGFDLSMFPSYYEPWGYTPLESLGFGIPTITTTLAGFGIWALNQQADPEVVGVISRNDDNEPEVVHALVERMLKALDTTPARWKTLRRQCLDLAAKANWNDLVNNYYDAWNIALEQLSEREDTFNSKRFNETLRNFNYRKQDQPTWKKILVQPVYTSELSKLNEMAQNLWWTWNFEAISLFETIDPVRWEEFDHNPIPLMESLTRQQMEAIENDAAFVTKLNKVYSDFKAYMEGAANNGHLIAYFSMEYGLHKSLKIYSGGLGVLAGDYLKQASDSAANMVGVGLLYRYGYFTQEISQLGDQIAQIVPQKFTHLPLEPVRDKNGDWITVSIELPGRTLIAKAWKVNVGRIPLYLLDTDIEENTADDRGITSQLYGGDNEMRFKQEMLLGIGGIRLFEKMGINPAIYHNNEGHSAFTGLERLRVLISQHGLSFDVAMEVVRSSNLFTTHTPVPAGHDSFEETMIRTYMSHYPARLNIGWDDFMNLGRFRANDPVEKFSMSVLASRLSQEVNGVSQIHGRVSRDMFLPMYPGYFADEMHIGYVTNGVHFPTWTDPLWQQLYRKHLVKGFENDQSNATLWKPIHQVPDQEIWDVRKELKSELVAYLKYRVKRDLTKRQDSPKLILNIIENLNENALIIGFARRFATYKRAHLLFTNLERLSKIVNHQDRPVLLLFAGKAHPNDKAGQDLIKRIIEISQMPDFVGKLLFIENYDMELGKRLTSSVDIWLNTPTRPLEASGTSGEKAVMNGVLNFSVLDGWWAEGYKKDAGWAIEEARTYTNQAHQDELDAETIYSLLENEIVPDYFERNKNGLPEKWITYIKNNISEIAPQFNMKRMLDDYYERFYTKLFKRAASMRANNYQFAHEVSEWKAQLKYNWDAIEVESIKVPDPTVRPLDFGENFIGELTLLTPNLNVGDVGIELLFGLKVQDRVDEIIFKEEMKIVASGDDWVRYRVNVPINRAGVYDYTFRIFPKNDRLPHRMDLPLLKWI